MSKQRKQYSSDFKVKVALAAVRGDEAAPQLVAVRCGLHPIQINSWKRYLIDYAAELFVQGHGINPDFPLAQFSNGSH